RRALNCYLAAVSRNDAPNEVEPKPVARNLRSRGGGSSFERFEDAGALCWLDSDPIVFDTNLPFSLPALLAWFGPGFSNGLCADFDLAALSAVFHGVADQVLEGASKRCAITPDCRQRLCDPSFDFETGRLQLSPAGSDG